MPLATTGVYLTFEKYSLLSFGVGFIVLQATAAQHSRISSEHAEALLLVGVLAQCMQLTSGKSVNLQQC
jgi:hypothetical protein